MDSNCSRRRFLATASVGIAGALAGCGIPVPTGGGNGRNVPTQNPGDSGGVGGGFAYKEPTYSPDQADHIVRNADQFFTALNRQNPRIWVPPDAAINISGRDGILTNGWIGSTRTTEHPGGIIYSDSMGYDSVAYMGGNAHGHLEIGQGGHMNGLRYRGPTATVFDHPWFPGYIPLGSGGESQREQFRMERHARGMTITHGNAMVDNCEIYGWPTHGVSVDCPRSFGRDQQQSYPSIQNASIHDCGMSGHGYGVHVITGHPICQNLYINGTRHAVAGDGSPDAGYTLANSYIGPANSLFQLDMHYLGENISGNMDPASYEYRYHSGELIRILGNTLTSTHVVDFANFAGGSSTPAVVIGSIPSQGVEIKGNTFAHPPPGNSPTVFSQGRVPPEYEDERGPNGFVRFDIGQNKYNADFGYQIGNP